jgi:hypothetical protein
MRSILRPAPRLGIDGGLRRLFRDAMPDGDWQPIETGGTVQGVPDSNYCFSGGVEGWVEFKLTHGWAVKIRPMQIGWLERRSLRGGRCCVAVRRHAWSERDGRAVADELYLVPGSRVGDVARDGLRGLECYAGGPGEWPWDLVKSFLLK